MEAHSLNYQPAQGDARLFSPIRVVALGLIAVVAGLAAWQFREESREGRVPLLADTLLPSSELALMEAAFDRAQLTDYTIDGGQILVPKGRQSGYMRALVDAEALPREFGGSLRRAMDSSSPWQSRATQDERLRIATQEELSLVLCSMPGIRRAAVLYDEEARASLSPSRGLGSGPRRTASVNIETDEDAAIDSVRARSIRVLVAASIAGLEPEDVAVTDLRSGLVYAGPLEPVLADVSPADASRIALEERLAERIRRSLAYVQGAIVDVRADLGEPQRAYAIPTATPQKLAEANAPADVRPMSPSSATSSAAMQLDDGRQVLAVHVAVAVPQSTSLGSDEAIQQHVLELLPATANPQARSVKVTRFHVGSSPAGTEHAAAAAAPHKPSSPALAIPENEAAVGDAAEPVFTSPLSGLSLEALRDMPEEAWLAAFAGVVMIIAGLLWWRGGRSTHTEEREPAIDWTTHTPARQPSGSAASKVGVATRAAAALLACSLCCGSARAAEEPPGTLLLSPLDAPVLLADPAEHDDAAAVPDAPEKADTAGSPFGMEATAALTMVAAIAGLIALSWLNKKQPATVPRDVFEVLGCGQLDRAHRVAVVRFGPKTLLVSIAGSSCSTLSELDDPAATETIAHACRHGRGTGPQRGSLRSPAGGLSVHTPPQPLESAA